MNEQAVRIRATGGEGDWGLGVRILPICWEDRSARFQKQEVGSIEDIPLGKGETTDYFRPIILGPGNIPKMSP